MPIYKITVQKTIFVEAETAEEAQEIYFDEGEMMSDERITEVAESCEEEMVQMMLGA